MAEDTKHQVDDRQVAQQQRNRRRFARRQWARRWLTWRYLLVAVLVAALLGFAAYALLFSTWLRVTEVEVLGESQLSEEPILSGAAVPMGEQLALVDLDAIEVGVRSLATVETVEVTRRWPDGVRIEVVERTPIAVIARGDRYTQLDASGVTFGRVPKVPDGLPQVRTGPGADRAAISEAAAVVDSLAPEISAMVGNVEVASVDRIRLHLRDGREVRWGSADASEDKAQVLLAFLTAEESGEAEPAQVYDVSVPGRPTTRN